MPAQLLSCHAQAVPLAIPEGSERWECSVRLAPTETETIRLPMKLRAPARILFIRPAVVVVGSPFLNSNLLADQFWAKIDVDDRTLLTTSTAGGLATNAPTTGNEVTFGSYLDALLNVHCGSPTPEIGFRYKSKHPAGVFGAVDVILSATVIGYYVDEAGNPIPRKVAA